MTLSGWLQNKAAQRRRHNFLRRPIVYPTSMEDLVREDAVLAFAEGDDEESCPIGLPYGRKVWLEAFREHARQHGFGGDANHEIMTS